MGTDHSKFSNDEMCSKSLGLGEGIMQGVQQNNIFSYSSAPDNPEEQLKLDRLTRQAEDAKLEKKRIEKEEKANTNMGGTNDAAQSTSVI